MEKVCKDCISLRLNNFKDKCSKSSGCLLFSKTKSKKKKNLLGIFCGFDSL